MGTKVNFINDNIFNEINSEKTAYWLGFLYADGYLRKYKYSYEIKLKLAIKDLQHLYKFKKFLSFSGKVFKTVGNNNNNELAEIRFYSENIFNNLCKFGCIPRKSLTIKFPLYLPTCLMNHFIRGYFDGDGCVTQSKDSVRISFVSGSYEFINEFQKYLIENLDLKNNKIYKSDIGNYYTLSWSNKENIIDFYNFIYKNSTIFLERKRIKFDNIIKNKKTKTIGIVNDNKIVKFWTHINLASKELKLGNREIIKRCKSRSDKLRFIKIPFFR